MPAEVVVVLYRAVCPLHIRAVPKVAGESGMTRLSSLPAAAAGADRVCWQLLMLSWLVASAEAAAGSANSLESATDTRLRAVIISCACRTEAAATECAGLDVS